MRFGTHGAFEIRKNNFRTKKGKTGAGKTNNRPEKTNPRPKTSSSKTDNARKPTESSWNRKIGNVHATVTKILDGYRKQGYIKGYSELTQPGNRIYGVAIEIGKT